MPDPSVVELGHRLVSEDEEILQETLLEIAELLNLWCLSWGSPAPTALPSDEARAVLRAALVACIDRDPTRPLAATAIFVLGKLYDNSLEPYLAKLARSFLHEDRLSGHLYQVIIALDNLEMIPGFQATDGRESLPIMRRVVADYRRARTP